MAPHTRIRLEHVLYSSLMASQQGQPNYNVNLPDQQNNPNNQPMIDFYKPQKPLNNPQINFVNEPNYYNFDDEKHNHNSPENQSKPDYLFLNNNQFTNPDDSTINNQDNSNNNFGSSISLNPSQPVVISPTQNVEDPFNFGNRVTRKPIIKQTTTTSPPPTTKAPPTRTTTTVLPDDTPDRFLE